MVCAGGAVVDLKLHLNAVSVPGTSNPASASTSFGGVARNVAEGLAGLLTGTDVSVELVSAVGDDAAGALLLAHLGDRGIGVDQVAVLPGEVTAQYVAVLEPGGDLTIGVAAMGVLDRIGTAALDAAWPAEGWLFCDGNLPAEVVAHILAKAREVRAFVAFDAVSTAKVTRLPADLRGLGLLCCNRDEARAWLAHHGLPSGSSGVGDGSDGLTGLGSGSEGDVELALRLRAAGAGGVLLTRGAAGLIAVDGEQVSEVDAVPAEVVDVTGAGDALVAGTLAGLIFGLSLADAAGFGAELAARTVESDHSVLPTLSSPGLSSPGQP